MKIEPDSATWRAVKAWAEARLSASRAANEARGLDPQKTEFERGRIALAKELLRLPEPSKINPAHSADEISDEQAG